MKSMLIKHIFMKIKDNYKRFLSLLSMALLGVGFYAGIQACSPDMLETLDDFYDKNNVFDIEIVSNLGLTDNDVKALSNINNIDKIIGIYSKDEYLNTINEQYVIRLIGLSNNINNVYLEEGRLPKNNNEIVVEKALLKDNNIKINDNIIINNVNYKIVGTVLSPLYFSTEKPTTTLGSGKVDYYAYTLDGNIKNDVYTNIYITVSNAKDELTNSNKYKSLIENVKNDIDKIKETLENRFGKVTDEMVIYMHEEWFEKQALTLGIKTVRQSDREIEIELPIEVSDKIKGDEFFIKAYNINPRFRLKYEHKQVIIALTLLNQKEHFLYYVVPLMEEVMKEIKK